MWDIITPLRLGFSFQQASGGWPSMTANWPSCADSGSLNEVVASPAMRSIYLAVFHAGLTANNVQPWLQLTSF